MQTQNYKLNLLEGDQEVGQSPYQSYQSQIIQPHHLYNAGNPSMTQDHIEPIKEEHINPNLNVPKTQIQLVINQCNQIEPELTRNYNVLQGLDLQKSDLKIQQSLDQLKQAKQELLNLVETYFNDVFNSFSNLCSKYPCQESKNQVSRQIEEILHNVQMQKEKIQDGTLQAPEVANFLTQNYPQTTDQINQEVNNLMNSGQNLQHSRKTSQSQQDIVVGSSNNTNQQDEFPQFKINRKCIDKLMFDLLGYITPVSSKGVPVKILEKPHISIQDHFPNQNSPNIGILDDKNQAILYYDLVQKENKKSVIPFSFKDKIKELPYQPSMLSLPDSSIFMTGGLDEKGLIQGMTLHQKLYDHSCEKLPDMNVKRCAHSLVYVPIQKTVTKLSKLQEEIQPRPSAMQHFAQGNQNQNQSHMSQQIQQSQQQQNDDPQNDVNFSQSGFIFSIGGRTNGSTRTKLCEKYNIEKRVWIPIAPLHHARSRPACCFVDNQYIFAFYGTDSQNQSNSTIERYDIMRDEWKVIQVQNHLPGFDICHAGAVQINKDQVLIAGGFRTSLCDNEESYIFNRNVMSFNLHSQTISLFNLELPQDCIVQGQPIIHKHSVFLIGQHMNALGQQARMNTDQYQVIQIHQNEVSVESQLDFAHNQQQNILDNLNNISRISENKQQQNLQSLNQSAQQFLNNNSVMHKQNPYNFARNSNQK